MNLIIVIIVYKRHNKHHNEDLEDFLVAIVCFCVGYALAIGIIVFVLHVKTWTWNKLTVNDKSLSLCKLSICQIKLHPW